MVGFVERGMVLSNGPKRLFVTLTDLSSAADRLLQTSINTSPQRPPGESIFLLKHKHKNNNTALPLRTGYTGRGQIAAFHVSQRDLKPRLEAETAKRRQSGCLPIQQKFCLI